MKSGASADTPAPSGQRSTWIGLSLAAFAFALYLPSLRNGFVNWDDFDYLTSNPHLGSFDWAYVQWSFTTWWHLNWHPLTWISYGIDHAVWGLNPLGFHLTNVVLHAVNSFLVFALAERLFARSAYSAGAKLAGATATAVLFAAHPLHVESVAWVSERKDVLYVAFTLLALLSYLRYVSDAPRTRARAYAATLVLFALSALAKPMAVTFPVVLLILDAWPLRRLGDAADRMRIVLIEKLPFFAVSLGVSWLTVAAQQAGGALKTGELPLDERVFVAVKALGFYLAKLVAPVPLVPLYPLESPIDPLRWDYLFALLAIVAISAAAVVWRRRAPALAAGWAFYLVTLLPVIGLVQVGAQAAADRYTYLPILGPLALVGAAVAEVFDARPALRAALAAVGAMVLVALSALTVVQIAVWRDSITLWEHVLGAYPGSVTAHYNLGNEYLGRGDYPNAEAWFRRTIELQPRHVMALNELGGLAGRRSAPDEALQLYKLAIEVSPTFAQPHFNIAQIYEYQRDFESARRHYEIFVQVAPPKFAPQVAEVRRKLASW
jgi:tetratricopeptide (TPR) repeat protein